MKTVTSLFIVLLFVFGCQEKSKHPKINLEDYIVKSTEKEIPKQTNFVTIKGSISNHSVDSLVVKTYPKKSFTQTITINSEGHFSDTLDIESSGNYVIEYNKKKAPIYLKKGYDLSLRFDTFNFQKTLTYSGYGAINNNYLVQYELFKNKILNYNAISDKSEEDLEPIFKSIKKDMYRFYALNTAVDSTVINASKAKLSKQLAASKKSIKYIISLKNVLPKGSKSPTFIDYEGFDGSKISLTDLKGKYVYIDVWATWCVPCIAEIPDLKRLEHRYKDRNIEFVSISVDRKKDYDKWKNFVQKEALEGIQLIAPKDFNSQFIKDYGITAIPRFIMIDPKGNVISPFEIRPSNPDIQSYFNSLENL